ncbi:MAG TPA: pitrilysin family protein, partial [Beijerinckiaceae bacterium]|nr:pitrilysin family protein [Beijerinckiaceae bacterium]
MPSLTAAAVGAPAANIQRVVSPKGIEAWLVEDYTVPIVSMDFAFIGGAALDPSDRNGLSNLMSGLYDEGAGDFDARAYQERLEEYAVEISFSSSKDKLEGSLRTLVENLQTAVDLLALAVQAPRFDEDAVQRVKAQIIAGLKRDENDPDYKVWRAFQQAAYPGHPYGRPTLGTIESVTALTRDDILASHQARLTREGLRIGVVGAIGPQALSKALDTIFGALPATAAQPAIADTAMAGLGTNRIVPVAVPQSTLALGRPAPGRKDPDFLAVFVVNHVLGGGAFTSRLWNEVREKRGLAYSVWSQLSTGRHANAFLAGTTTSNERAAESLAIIRQEVLRMAESGPTADELDRAKKFLIGSYALRFDTSRKIAGNLVELQVEDMGMDYIATRNERLAALSLDDSRRAAGRLLGDGALLVAA